MARTKAEPVPPLGPDDVPDDNPEDGPDDAEADSLERNARTGRIEPGSIGPGRSKRALPGKMTRSAAMKRLGCGKQKLARLVTEGKLGEPEKDTEGRWWYEVEAIEDLAEDDDEREIGAAQLILAASKIIDQQFNHHEAMMTREQAMMGAFLTATHQILGLQTEWSSKAMVRAEKLQTELSEAHDTIQSAMDLNQQRELALADAAHRQQRNDKIYEKISSHLPTVLAFVGKKFGADPGVAADPLVRELMSTLTQEQAVRLAESGILNQDQLGKMLALWEVMKGKDVPDVEPAAPPPPPPPPST